MLIKVRSVTNVGLYIACFIAFTFYGVDYFIPGLTTNMTTVYMICGGIIVLCSLCRIFKSGFIRIGLWDIVSVLLLILPLLWNNRDLEVGGFRRPLQYLWVAALYLAFRSSKREDWIDKFFKIIMFVGIFYAFFTIISFISSDFYFNFLYPTLSSISTRVATRLANYYSLGYMTGITAHYSTNGIYIGLGIIPFFVCVIMEKDYIKKGRLATFIAFILIFLALALTGKRAHLIFTIVALIIVMYFYYSDQKYSRAIKILFYLLVAALIVYIVSLFIPQVLNVYNRILEGLAENNIDNGRAELSEYALLAFSSAPIFGHGWSWFSQYNTISHGDHTHNTYYQLLCETGVIGFAFYIVFFVFMLIRAIVLLTKICRRKQNYQSRDRVVVSSAVAYEIFFLMYMVTGNPLYEFSCYMPLFLFVAAVETIRGRIKKGEIEMIQEVED